MRRQASAIPTARVSSPPVVNRAAGSPRAMATTTATAEASASALSSSSPPVPTDPTARAASPDPAMPPRLAPPPMNPNSRRACLAS